MVTCILLFLFLLKLKKDVDLEKAGLQFISYQELQATVCDKCENNPTFDAGNEEDASDEAKTEKTGGNRTEVGGMFLQQETPVCDEGQQEEEEASHLVEHIKIREIRRGTEMKLLGLRLGENTATVAAQQITVCLQCNR